MKCEHQQCLHACEVGDCQTGAVDAGQPAAQRCRIELGCDERVRRVAGGGRRMVGDQMGMESSREREDSEGYERVGFDFGGGRALCGVSVVFGRCAPGELSNLAEEGGGMKKG